MPDDRGRTCSSSEDTLRSCDRSLRSSMVAYSSSIRRPALGRSGEPVDSCVGAGRSSDLYHAMQHEHHLAMLPEVLSPSRSNT